MSEALFPLLLALTLLDLGFVQATGVVDAGSLLPLWALALLAFRLRRWTRFAAYRLLWNAGVVLVFVLLVHHATTTGLLHMLEDGLLLAVLCQVHLLNNVGERQRPDLVFCNSLLVAFVTSWFAPDLAWSALFLLHTLVLLPALQVHALAGDGRECPPKLLRRLGREALPRSLAVAAVAAALFVLVPRDFARSGWLGAALLPREQLVGGGADRIELDRGGPVRLDDAVVMVVRPASGRPDDVPEHWRTIAFTDFDGRAWWPQDALRLGSRFATDPEWSATAPGTWRREVPPRGAPLHVRLHDVAGRRLPAPLLAAELRLETTGGLLLDPKSYGGFGCLRVEDAPAGPIDFAIDTTAALPPHRVGARARAALLALPSDGLPAVLHTLADQLRATGPAAGDVVGTAEHFANWLRENRRYQLPGTAGAARNLGEFLLGTSPGHCEYFATALALLLRLQEVPCRVVGGYLVHEWDPVPGAMVVRARDAHAWVEVLAPGDRWLTVDATPPSAAVGERQPAAGWWDALHRDLERWWQGVVGFDRTRRLAWLAAVGRAWPWWSAFVAALLLAGWWWRSRRSLPVEVRGLRRALRQAGVQLHAGETPQECVARAAAGGAAPAALAALRAAVARHEAARYAAPLTDCRAAAAGRG